MIYKNDIIRTISLLLLVLTAIVLFSEQTQADTLNQGMQKQIPKIIDYLNEHEFKTVGVLKFRVKKPGQKTTSSAGPLNSHLADRLEVGLILANPFDEARQLNIIKDASATAAKIDKANHLSEAGRKAFFGPRFKLAWGNKSEVADAFLTGVVQMHDDNQRATIGILCFNRNGGGLEKACEVFDVNLDAETLGELGESFLLRGAFDGGSTQLAFKDHQKQKQQQILKAAARVKTQQVKFPLDDSAAPIKLEILYDGHPVAVELRDGQAFVAEPQTGQKVELALNRNHSTQGRLGAVLKVNGENTLYRQVVRDIDCAKWILSPDHKRTVVKGYQLQGNKAEKFTVLSKSDSAKRAMDYGREVGQIQLTVFQELKGAKPVPTILNEEDQDLIAMLRGVHPSGQPKNLGALKHQIRLAGRKEAQTRGLIVQGKKSANKVQTVIFNADPTPVMSVTITYFKP
ncbi:MAG: hypothetical protein CME31_01790 [Gimesia sp.]|uniref:SLA1 homology domain-containing protein n=1 Tax=Gimesia maris TaxID=122 RepID=A0A3D3R8K5_9PLAN|nr:hypothetical protein [Gimesia sp.]HCO25109.1 hypothetical protein [Gimesia maris]|tara:strand:- start:55025 stop:56398 length:1374 start_codon:yes stop_codon:yes gene_type:complete